MFKVKAIAPFDDIKEKVARKVGEEFIVDKKRLDQIKKNSQAKGITFIEVVEEEILTTDNIVEATEETKEDLVSKPKKKK